MRKIKVFVPSDSSILSPVAGIIPGYYFEYQETEEFGETKDEDLINELSKEQKDEIKKSGKIWKKVYLRRGHKIAKNLG